MSKEALLLIWTAAGVGFIHTVLGLDHYLPFIVMSKCRKWSTWKTAVITFLCGVGHVLSSVALGLLGIAFGIAVFKLKFIESYRGDIAAWFLIIFGFVYFVWGLHNAIRGKTHKHFHLHPNQEPHSHAHSHIMEHTHIHQAQSNNADNNITPWVLFTIFVFGPCEPLIPLIMYPAAQHNTLAVILVAVVFGLVTISTMLAIVTASAYGLSRLPLFRLEKYSHALAGLAILLCGGLIKFFGL